MWVPHKNENVLYIFSPSASLMDPISSCCGVFPWLTMA